MLTSINPLIPGSKTNKNSRRAITLYLYSPGPGKARYEGNPCPNFQKFLGHRKNTARNKKQRYPHHTIEIIKKCQGAAFDKQTFKTIEMIVADII